MTVPEVMTALKLSRSKVYDLLRSGQLRSFTVGRARRIPADEITRVMSENMQEAA
ncbi:helix-turn-helix domain-containing protein [Streptomyces albidus (ex Kaewkla and Franco 2022)]|uniref:helix-turn-helix domain-containing protein n=1 Tax=Streptomyces albidus (ex Kaewkla and Franco 2022) TaxID=722709 RepID=UPI0015EF3F98|nr:helix-turn-helix domain-containing protein [Streptomyces albidus (ex Kaewkla and Franco 2022)]